MASLPWLSRQPAFPFVLALALCCLSATAIAVLSLRRCLPLRRAASPPCCLPYAFLRYRQLYAAVLSRGAFVLALPRAVPSFMLLRAAVRLPCGRSVLSLRQCLPLRYRCSRRFPMCCALWELNKHNTCCGVRACAFFRVVAAAASVSSVLFVAAAAPVSSVLLGAATVAAAAASTRCPHSGAASSCRCCCVSPLPTRPYAFVSYAHPARALPMCIRRSCELQ